MTDTPKLEMPELASQQSQPEVTHNEALRVLDATVCLNVIDKDLDAAPGAPSDGDTYIVGGDPSSADDWSGEADSIAYFQNTAWVFITPAAGWLAYVQDEESFYVFKGTSAGWELFSTVDGSNAYDVAGFMLFQAFSGTLLRLEMARPVRFADDMAGSTFSAGVAASGETVFSLQKDDVEFGTMTVAAAETTATFDTDSGAVEFAAGEVLTVVSAAADGEMKEYGWILKGERI